MSERRTYTLEDSAVSYLEKVPKELNSKFVSSLIVSFFEGESLLSFSEWQFLSDLVDRDGNKPDPTVSLSSGPVDREKDRLRRILLLLDEIDLSVYSEFNAFLSNTDVRVGGFFDLSLAQIHRISGSFRGEESTFYNRNKAWVFLPEWDFLGVVPESYWDSYSANSLEYVLKKEAVSLKPAFDLRSFLRSFLSVVSSLVLEDLFYVEEHGMSKADWLEKVRVEREAKKEKESKRLLEEENRLRHEKEEQVLRDRKEFDGKKLEFISSLEEEIKKGLVGVSCSYLHILSRCEGNLVKGYFLSSYEYNSDFPFGEPVYSPVCCKKHLSKFALVDWEKGEFRYLERTYKIVSEVLP